MHADEKFRRFSSVGHDSKSAVAKGVKMAFIIETEKFNFTAERIHHIVNFQVI